MSETSGGYLEAIFVDGFHYTMDVTSDDNARLLLDFYLNRPDVKSISWFKNSVAFIYQKTLTDPLLKEMEIP